MRRLTLISSLLLILSAVAVAAAPVQHRPPRNAMHGPTPFLRGGGQETGKALPDTVDLYGGPGTDEGKFETAYGPDWMGWTHRDLTRTVINHWHISTYFAENLNGNGPGNRAMWCGDSLQPACSPTDTIGGVVSNMLDNLAWQETVADPLLPTTVNLTAYVNYELVDLDWDFLEL